MDRFVSRARAIWVTLWGFAQLHVCGGLHAAPIAMDSGRPANGGRWVVLVHGINDSARSMRWMQRALEADGRNVRAVSLKPNDASVPFEELARQLDGFVASNIPAGEKYDLVAFSMGGLVARYYIQKMGGGARVGRLVTISTPNHGTEWAWLSGRAGIKEMRPGSAMLRELNGNTAELARLSYTSIYTPLDLSIVPASSSRMMCARNVVAWAPAHALMVRLPGPIRAVERALDEPR